MTGARTAAAEVRVVYENAGSMLPLKGTHARAPIAAVRTV
eukprot:CAMPEP_0206464700 /NCGR_PEP_ID=MMETSP0324_2-20121206/27371_1 /ASSEMBLY_ACC=CAM_ASM_000836 /TAXON_ID=2866 /ORGANISM="Crypthecodinium cohnii, Strain Seligo" /LENGTH=39 /DNA_ID= /DNA_START= /DNA_END= /DNA_ORIENTATION=